MSKKWIIYSKRLDIRSMFIPMPLLEPFSGIICEVTVDYKFIWCIGVAQDSVVVNWLLGRHINTNFEIREGIETFVMGRLILN